MYVACTYILRIPVEMPEAGELVDFDGVSKAGKVDGVHLLLDERQVVPDEAALDDLRLVRCPHQPLGKYGGLDVGHVSFLQ